MATPSYATPTDDQMAWRDARCGPDLLPAHLVAFVQGGVGVTLGARRDDGRPVVGTGIACRVRSMTELRVLLSRRANITLLEAVQAGSGIAATFSRARDHRSIQFKASEALVTEIAPDDMSEALRQSSVFSDDLVELGYTRLQADAYAFRGTTDLVALEFRPGRVFTQTPGPGAGAELPR